MRTIFLFALALAPASVVVAACADSDDSISNETRSDSGADTGPGPTVDSGPPTDAGAGPRKCGDVTGAPPRLLLTIGQPKTSEMAAVNLETNAVDGRLSFASSYGVTWSKNDDPYLLAQETDVVSRLDPQAPWKVLSTWSVRGDDAKDGGLPNANPSAIAVPSCAKGYVLRFNRNKIAVIDTTEIADGGAPKSYIDLSSYVAAGDEDGVVEMTSALWVPSKGRIFVLLGNIDIPKVASDGFTALCASSKPAIIAIDPATDTVDPSIAYTLEGYNPPLGAPFFYDAATDRFLVLSAGCNLDDGDGGAGAIARRRVEAVDAKTGAVTTLVSLDDKPFPSALEWIDGSHAAVAFFGTAYFWDPRFPALGAPIAGGMDFMAEANANRIVGARATYADDGGPGPIQVVSVPLSDAGAGGATVIAQDPFTKNTGFMSSAEVWPRP